MYLSIHYMLDSCFSTNLMRCDSLSIVSPLCMNLQVVNFRRWDHAFLWGVGGWLEVLFSKEKMCVYEADSGCGNRKNDSGSDWLKMPRKDSGNQKCTIGSYEKGG